MHAAQKGIEGRWIGFGAPSTPDSREYCVRPDGSLRNMPGWHAALRDALRDEVCIHGFVFFGMYNEVFRD